MRDVEDEGRDAGEAELGAQAPQRTGLPAPERVRRDIWIAERDHGDAATGEGADDRERRLCRLVQVVDQHEAQSRDPVARTAADDLGDRESGQLCGVELRLTARAHDAQVLVDEVGARDPLRPAGALAEPAQSRRVDPVLGRPRHEVAQLGAEAAQASHALVEQLRPLRAGPGDDVALEDRGDIGVELARRDETRRFGAVGPRSCADDLEGERRHRASERPGARPLEPECETVAQSRRGGAR
jgi:hypothetical protein